MKIRAVKNGHSILLENVNENELNALLNQVKENPTVHFSILFDEESNVWLTLTYVEGEF